MTSRTLTAKYAGASLFLSTSTVLLMLFLSFGILKKKYPKNLNLSIYIKMDYIQKNASAAEVNIAFIRLPTPPAQLQKNPKSPFYQKVNKSPAAARNLSALLPKSNVTPRTKKSNRDLKTYSKWKLPTFNTGSNHYPQVTHHQPRTLSNH